MEDAVLQGDADDTVRVLPKTSFACFSTGGEPTADALAAPAPADIDRCKSAVFGEQAYRYRRKCRKE